jgi:PAS domain S-box-containing protein
MKLSKALRYTGVFVLISVIISILIIYVERNTLSTYQRNLPYLILGDNVKNRITKGHLWFEEVMAGDRMASFDKDVIPLFTSSYSILVGAYKGQENELGNFEKSSDEDTQAFLKESYNSVEKLTQAARERWKFKQEGGQQPVDSLGNPIGEDLDARLDRDFDAAYERTLATLDKLTDHVNTRVNSDSSYLNGLSWVSITLVILTFGAISVLLYRFQVKSDKQVKESDLKLNEESRRVDTLTSFIEAVSSGNYSIDLGGSSDEDNLTRTLVQMRDKLRENAEEDRRRNWSTSGLAQIGEILRATSGTSNDLYDKIIQFVVKYTRSNQGGLFILDDTAENESDYALVLVSAYAFERKKFIQKRVNVGQGLIGQSFLEGERIYLLEVPQEYVSITSGLGGTTPNALLLMPMKVNGKVFGIIELASFHKYEEYEVELVEKLAESIASTISTVKINEATKELLEKTQQQAEEMRAQEEEMRQNMEELEATQEEMRRKEKHIQKMLDDEKLLNVFKENNTKKLSELTKNTDIQAGHWDKSVELLTSTIAGQLQVSRSSIWMYDSAAGKLTCEKLFSADTLEFESGQELLAKDYPVYFAELRKERDIVAADAQAHAATRELAFAYLKPNRVESLLDLPFFNDGKVVGIVRCEQQGARKEWNDDHETFLRACADLAASAYKAMKMNALVRELHQSQDTLQAIIDNVPRAIFWKDHDLRFQGCNRIFAEAAGLRFTREIIGKTDYEMPWKAHADLYRKDDREVMMENKAKLNIEEVNVDREGRESWVLTSKVPIADDNGRIVAILGMFEDITLRKRKDADISHKLDELEQLRKQIAGR